MRMAKGLENFLCGERFKKPDLMSWSRGWLKVPAYGKRYLVTGLICSPPEVNCPNSGNWNYESSDSGNKLLMVKVNKV